METKKSKVTAIEENKRQYAGQNGTIHYHTITFENGDVGVYGGKSEKCTKFVIGQEADYTKEVKVNGAYTNCTIKPIQQNPSTHTAKPKYPEKDTGIITYLSCLSSVCNYFQQRNSDPKDVFAMAEEAFIKATEKSTLNK